MKTSVVFMDIYQISEYSHQIIPREIEYISKLFTFNDVYIITKCGIPAEIVCQDKHFISSLRHLITSKKFSSQTFTTPCRCCIIDYESITQLIDFNEFCSRYGERV